MKASRLVSAIAVLATCSSAWASFSYSVNGSTYSQDFDTLATTGTANTWTNDTTLPGWFSLQRSASGTAGTRDATTNATATYRSDGTANAGGLWSWGSTGSTERALGSISSGTPGDFAWGIVLKNDTPDILDSFTLSFNTEQWRQGGQSSASPPVGTQHRQVLDYAIFASDPAATDLSAANTTGYTAPGGNWDAVGPITTAANTGTAVDGNDSSVTGGRVNGRGGVASVTWNPGEYLVIRWWDDNDTGNDHGIGIDDVSFSATPEPGTLALLGLAAVAMIRRRR